MRKDLAVLEIFKQLVMRSFFPASLVELDNKSTRKKLHSCLCETEKKKKHWSIRKSTVAFFGPDIQGVFA